MQHNVLALSAMFDALVETGNFPVQRSAVPLRGLLLRLVEDQQPQAEDCALRLALRLPPAAAGVVVDTDPALLETMLRNLLANAIKYTRQGGVMLVLRRRHLHPEGGITTILSMCNL